LEDGEAGLSFSGVVQANSASLDFGIGLSGQLERKTTRQGMGIGGEICKSSVPQGGSSDQSK
jgi:hypothetical protein